MKNRIKNALIACLVFSMLCCTSCNKPNNGGDSVVNSNTNKITDRDSLSSDATIAFKDLNVQGHVEKSFVQNNVSVSINSDVIVPEADGLFKAVFVFDEENMNRIVNEWLLPAYPDAKTNTDESFDYGWGTSKEDGSVLMGFSADRDGEIGFIDSVRNIDGTAEGYHTERRYITNTIPSGMNIDAKEAEKEARLFVEKYSPFKYSAYKISDINDKQKIKGYYEIYLQPEYKNIPVCIAQKCEGYGVSLDFEVCLSAEGIFAFQGKTNLKEKECVSVDNMMPFDSIMDYFSSDIAVLATGTDVRVKNIYLALIPDTENPGSPEITLTPAWCFEYSDTRIEAGEEITLEFTVAYSVENGRIIGQFF